MDDKRFKIYCLFCGTMMASIEPILRWVCFNCNADLIPVYKENKVVSIKIENYPE